LAFFVPGSPATGLRRRGGSKSQLAQRQPRQGNWRTALNGLKRMRAIAAVLRRRCSWRSRPVCRMQQERVSPLASPRNCPARGRKFLIISPARSSGIVEFGGIGFMSTQRREIRLYCAGCSFSAEAIGQNCPSSTARNCLTNTDGGTAPLVLAGLATNSLQSDHRFARVVLFVWLVQLVQLVQFASSIGPSFRFDTRLGLPPLGAGRRPATGTPASYRLSLPFSPIPSVSPRLLLT